MTKSHPHPPGDAPHGPPDAGVAPPPGPIAGPPRRRDAEDLLCECAATLRDRRARLPDRDPTPADAWGRFHRDLTPHLVATTRRGRRGALEPDDAAQEAWLSLVAHVSLYRDDVAGGGFPAWLTVVVRNRLANLSRRAVRRPVAALSRAEADGLLGREEDPADSHERRRARSEVREAIAEARDRVSEVGHRIIVLRWLDGRTVPEIAEALGMTASQVRDRHRRAFPILRSLIRRRFGMGPDDPRAERPGAHSRTPGPEGVNP